MSFSESLSSKVGQVLEVEIEKVIYGGDGLARAADGVVLFVPFTCSGERVEVCISSRKAHHGRAEAVEIKQPSAAREKPPCPYYMRCGGCQYQHLSYEEECRLKQAQVLEAMTRLGKLVNPPIRPIIPSPNPYQYRNRITVHVENGRIGFHDLSGREVVDVRQCLIARESVNAELTKLRESRPLAGHYSLRDKTIPPSGFFQANGDLQGTLLYLVAASLPRRGATLLEGYCGGGFFTKTLAERFEQVLAIDNDPRTLRDAHRLGLANVEWQQGDAATLLPEILRARSGHPTAVLLDPPREGLPVRLTEALGQDPVSDLCYVSCNPATLARDAQLLAKTYQLVSVQPIDLFPRTAQIECVTVWKR